MVTVSGNPNPTNPTYPTNPTKPTNPTTKYRCEFSNLNCIYASVTPPHFQSTKENLVITVDDITYPNVPWPIFANFS